MSDATEEYGIAVETQCKCLIRKWLAGGVDCRRSDESLVQLTSYSVLAASGLKYLYTSGRDLRTYAVAGEYRYLEICFHRVENYLL